MNWEIKIKNYSYKNLNYSNEFFYNINYNLNNINFFLCVYDKYIALFIINSRK